MQSIIITLTLLICVAYFSLFERKLLSLSQNRLGPNKVGPLGLLQPLSDAPKLLSKATYSQNESWEPFLMPFVAFFVSVLWWIPIPIPFNLWELENSLLILILISSVSTYGVVYCGVLAKSKYSVLGSLRAIVLSISFEFFLSTAVLVLIVVFSTFNIKVISLNQGVPHLMSFPAVGLTVWISFTAECARSPLDLPESESELVSGFNVEYGGSRYVLIYLSEGLLLMISSILMNILFTCKYNPLIIILWITVSIILRASVPRMRYDKCMKLGWEFLIPVLLSFMSIHILL
uniref:NADH-ubiquinone oxidoreductase chain 1 n=1 Tax=Pediculus schaeffi TaxID=240286 RepID=M4VNQ6_PEDSC|nr:NADH dehydrogenase subunit 1 [Pediculus schaeffi]